MAQAPSILNADRGRATVAALGILCLLAAVQVTLTIRAVWHSTPPLPSEAKTATSDAAPAPAAAPVITPIVSFTPPPPGYLAPALQPNSAPMGFSPPPVGSLAAPSPAPAPLGPPPLPGQTVSPAPAAPPLAVTQPEAAPLPEVLPGAQPPAAPAKPAANGTGTAAEMSLQEMVDLAKQVRGLGDMQGALEVLKRADLQYPGRPEVLAETAQCYETMGLTDKAMALWRQVEGMDPARAGGFKDLAQRRLNTPAAAPAAPSFGGLNTGSEGPKVLSLGACQVHKDPTMTNGEKVVLRIPILRQGNVMPDPSQVDIDVYFFDRVNGEKIALTIANEPVSTWAAAPVDWSGIGEEPLDVTYFLPALTPGEVAAHGRRAYHGYVVRLYYQHKLQDVAAEPRDLLDFGSRTPQAGPGDVNPLLPPLTN